MILWYYEYKKKGDSMDDLVIIRKGEYLNKAIQETGYIGVIASINQVEISELFIKKGKLLLLIPGINGLVNEFAYLLEGELVEESGAFTITSGDSFYISELNRTLYTRAREDCRMLYLSNESVVTALTDSMKNLHEMVSELDKKDHYTKSHSGRVVEWAPLMAKAMNLNERELQVLLSASLFHDVGKLEISNEILHKPASLSEGEFACIKNHPSLGKAIAESHHLYEVGEVIEQHHERIDGSGYPNGLKGEAIRIEAKIIAVIDSYDAMTSDRPYRDGMSRKEAVEELSKYKGIYYDADIVDCFFNILNQKWS